NCQVPVAGTVARITKPSFCSNSSGYSSGVFRCHKYVPGGTMNCSLAVVATLEMNDVIEENRFVSSVLVPAVRFVVVDTRTPVSEKSESGKSVRFLFVFAVLNTTAAPAPPSAVQPRAMVPLNSIEPAVKAVPPRAALRIIERSNITRVASTQRIWKISELAPRPAAITPLTTPSEYAPRAPSSIGRPATRAAKCFGSTPSCVAPSFPRTLCNQLISVPNPIYVELAKAERSQRMRINGEARAGHDAAADQRTKSRRFRMFIRAVIGRRFLHEKRLGVRTAHDAGLAGHRDRRLVGRRRSEIQDRCSRCAHINPR